MVILVAVIILAVLDAGAVVSLLTQRSDVATAPSGRNYRVRLTATGVRWVSWGNLNFSWLGSSLRWIRYLRSTRRGTWTVVVIRKWAVDGDAPLIIETFANATDARFRVRDLATAITQGTIDLSADDPEFPSRELQHRAPPPQDP